MGAFSVKNKEEQWLPRPERYLQLQSMEHVGGAFHRCGGGSTRGRAVPKSSVGLSVTVEKPEAAVSWSLERAPFVGWTVDARANPAPRGDRSPRTGGRPWDTWML